MTETPDTSPEAVERLAVAAEYCYSWPKQTAATLRALSADNAALRAEVKMLRGALEQIESITPMWEGGVSGPSPQNLRATIEDMKAEARAALTAPAPRHR